MKEMRTILNFLHWFIQFVLSVMDPVSYTIAESLEMLSMSENSASTFTVVVSENFFLLWSFRK